MGMPGMAAVHLSGPTDVSTAALGDTGSARSFAVAMPLKPALLNVHFRTVEKPPLLQLGTAPVKMDEGPKDGKAHPKAATAPKAHASTANTSTLVELSLHRARSHEGLQSRLA